MISANANFISSLKLERTNKMGNNKRTNYTNQNKNTKKEQPLQDTEGGKKQKQNKTEQNKQEEDSNR